MFAYWGDWKLNRRLFQSDFLRPLAADARALAASDRGVGIYANAGAPKRQVAAVTRSAKAAREISCIRAFRAAIISENPDDWKRAYTDLERIQREAPGASIVVNNASQNSDPTNMLPPGFVVVHPPLTTSTAAPDDNVRDLAEPLSFDGPSPKRDRERGLW